MQAIGRTPIQTPDRRQIPLSSVATIREVCPFLDDDRPLGGEIEAVAAMVLAGRFRT